MALRDIAGRLVPQVEDFTRNVFRRPETVFQRPELAFGQDQSVPDATAGVSRALPREDMPPASVLPQVPPTKPKDKDKDKDKDRSGDKAAKRDAQSVIAGLQAALTSGGMMDADISGDGGSAEDVFNAPGRMVAEAKPEVEGNGVERLPGGRPVEIVPKDRSEEEDAQYHNDMKTFLTKWENPEGLTRAHFPGDRAPRRGSWLMDSGVTLGIGCDLGNRTPRQMLDLGVDPALVKKLQDAQYFGKKGTAAWNALQAHPLTLSRDELAQLDAIVMEESRAKAQGLVDKYAGDGVWDSMTPAQQIGLTSGAHQGTFLAKDAALLRNGRWDLLQRQRLNRAGRNEYLRGRMQDEHRYMNI